MVIIIKKIQWKELILSFVIALGVGGLSALLTPDSKEIYSAFTKPPLSPPSEVFPIVWTALFILMAIAAYLVYVSDSSKKDAALAVYALQLFFNFLWTVLFFAFRACVPAFVCLVILWVLILITVLRFYRINRVAGYLMLPYIAWTTFAGYLNLAICILN